MKKVTAQSSKDKLWKDETGFALPYNRLTPVEKLQERYATSLINKAIGMNAKLTAFKESIKEMCQEVYDKFMEENNNTKPSKGNFTWFNFDRSIKIEVSVSDRIDFDDLTIAACKDKLHEFLEENVESKDAFIKQLVLDSFETSRGKLDAKKVMSLLKYKNKIKHPLFTEAMDLLNQSIRKPDSKTYFRIWLKDKDGKYQNVDLNFSSI